MLCHLGPQHKHLHRQTAEIEAEARHRPQQWRVFESSHGVHVFNSVEEDANQRYGLPDGHRLNPAGLLELWFAYRICGI